MSERSSAIRQLVALFVLSAVSLALPLFAPFDPLLVITEARLQPPSPEHLLGTDELGRDILSRVLWGTATTVTVSVVSLISALLIGVIAGAVAGYYYQRWPDRLIMWIADVLSAIPFLVFVAGVLAIWGGGLLKAYVLLTLVMWTNSARQVRGEVIKIMPLDWVAADRVAGLSEANILFRKVLPKCISPAVLFSLSYLPDIVALEAGLSFLGLGLQPPEPGLGKMIFDGISYSGSAWWISLAPASMLVLIVVFARALGNPSAKGKARFLGGMGIGRNRT
ncbi:ABC transporter permease [Hyphomonas sp.]|uniref:ABC transporter permease n=1 Tax=Hyphomonas sp. TaxID=87 RepID=UPI0025C016BA|nr:ABC transporter permease [Hyphomonas sp.]